MKTRTFKRLFAVLLAMLMVLGLAACSKSDDAATDDGNSVTAYVGTSIFGSLDPIKGSMSYGYDFICNALIKVDPDSNYVADLATDWSISADALTYTFNLQKDVKFSDGSDFTAEDVVFTYETVKANQANNEDVDLTKLASVTAKDDYTVEFKLSEPYSPFLDTTAMLQIVPSDAYDSEKFDTAPIGTGAWKVVQYDTNQQIILEANKDSFAGAPKLDRVTLVYMDQEAAFAAAKSGQLDIVMVSPSYAKETVDGMTLQSFETMDVRNVSMPMRPQAEFKDADGNTVVAGNNVTADKAVRQALSIGIDRQTIIDNAFNGVGVPAVNFTDNLLWASTNNFTDNRLNEAKGILEDAGWTVDADGYRSKDGQKCEFDVYAPGGDQDRYALAEALADNAKNLGIKINVKTASWDEVGTLKNTSGIVWGWGQYSPTVLKSLFESTDYPPAGYDNVVGLNSATVDSQIKAALSANNQADAIANWKLAQDTANAEYPYLYLVNIRHCYFVKDGLDISMATQIPHPHGHGSPIINNMKDWSLK